MKLKIRLVKSPIGYEKDQKATLKALGLRKVGRTVLKPDNPQIRGMINKCIHLVAVEEINVDYSAGKIQENREMRGNDA